MSIVRALPFVVTAGAAFCAGAFCFTLLRPEPPTAPPEPEYELADPSCKDYLAIVGEPCSAGHWLHVRSCSRYTPTPAPPVCECAIEPVQK
jgi:hypothetical protein